MEILHYFPKVSKGDQNDTTISQMKVQCAERPKEMTNNQDHRSHWKKKTPQVQNSPPNKIIIVTLAKSHANYEITNGETASLYEALNTLDPVKEEIESQPGKEILVCGKKGIEGYINLGMPLRCFPEGSHVVITFSKTESEQREDKHVFGRFGQSSAECVVFYLYTDRNRKQRILRCRELYKVGTKLCVYGFKGETIQDTLRKDGRFDSFVESNHWKLINNLGTAIESSQPIDELEGKLFQIEFGRKKFPRTATTTQNSELKNRSFSMLKGHIVNLYPTLKREQEKLRAYIKEESEKGKMKTSLFKVHRENFRKLTQNSTPGNIFKLLSQLSDSVGLIVWNNNGNRGSATCFVFRGLYIFTCRHVISDIVGEGIEPSKWADIISQCVSVTFEYEVPATEDSYCFVEPWFEVSDVTLDYAVLKLKESGQHIPAGLCNGIPAEPLSGIIYVIGHPDGKYKMVDGCVAIPVDEQRGKCEANFQGKDFAGGTDPVQYIYMYTQRSFQKKIHVTGTATCDNTFFCGSSGSPVFNSKGSLVAIHTAGVICEYTSGVSSIIEFGSAMEHILSDIKQKHERWYNEICVPSSMEKC